MDERKRGRRGNREEERRKKEEGRGLASAIDGLPETSPVDLGSAIAHRRVPHTTWGMKAQSTWRCVSGIGHQAPATTWSRGCACDRISVCVVSSCAAGDGLGVVK